MNIAIIGSGPSAFYTVQSLLREKINLKIDIFEKLPAPFGLVRYGVAPDHQKTKNITRLFTKYLYEEKVNYFGNIEIGKDISIELLSDLYDAVIMSSGATEDRQLNIEGDDFSNVYGSGKFVGWYNGNPNYSSLSPNFRTKNAIIIGNGNVALDCARVLAKCEEELYQSDIMNFTLNYLNNSEIENIYIIGRRTPKDSKFTISELREIGDLKLFDPVVDYDIKELERILDNNIDTKIKKNIEVFINFKKLVPNKRNKIIFKFLSTPHRIVNKNSSYDLLIKKNKLVNNKIISTQEKEVINAGLIISAIGYKVSPIEGLKLDSTGTFFLNHKGHIKKNIYTNGWAAGASVGVIGTNKIGASLLAKKILTEIKNEKNNSREKVLEYFNSNSLKYISKDDWKKIDQIEINQAMENFVRKKIVDLKEIFRYLKS